jgi:hypothetical protein
LKKLIITCSENPQELSIAMEIIAEFKQMQLDYMWLHVTRNNHLDMEFPIADLYRKLRFNKNMKKESNNYLKQIALEDLSKFNFSDKPLEDAALRSALTEIISSERNSEPCLDCNSSKLIKYKDEYLRIYKHLLQIQLQEKFESIYVYNGRFLLQSAIWKSATDSKTSIKFFEKINISNPKKYFVFDEAVHSPSERARAIKKLIANTERSYEEIQEIGSDWFLKRFNGLSQKFTRSQTEKFCRFSVNKTLVSFFHSSEDELIQSSLIDKKFGNQFQILEFLADFFSAQIEVDFIIRMHPNLKYKDKREIRKWNIFLTSLSCKYSNLKVIHHDEPINSYSLISESDLILTAGSLIAVEAAFLGKANIILGPSLHSEIGSSYVSNSIGTFKKDFQSYLNNYGIKTKYSNSINFGYFQEEGGISFNHMDVNDSGSLFVFNKRKYGHDKFYIILQKLSKLKKLVFPSVKSKMCQKC